MCNGLSYTQEIKVDEYILGKGKRSSVGDTSEDRDEERREQGDKRKVCIITIVSWCGCPFLLLFRIKGQTF